MHGVRASSMDVSTGPIATLMHPDKSNFVDTTLQAAGRRHPSTRFYCSTQITTRNVHVSNLVLLGDFDIVNGKVEVGFCTRKRCHCYLFSSQYERRKLSVISKVHGFKFLLFFSYCTRLPHHVDAEYWASTCLTYNEYLHSFEGNYDAEL